MKHNLNAVVEKVHDRCLLEEVTERTGLLVDLRAGPGNQGLLTPFPVSGKQALPTVLTVGAAPRTQP